MSEYTPKKISEKVIVTCNKVIDVFLVATVLGMSFVVFIQVIFRYVFESPLSWPEETTRLMLVWLTFLGGYVALRENKHMNFELIIKNIPKPYCTLLEIIRELSIIIFIIVVIVEGAKFSLRFKDVSFTYINLSLGIFSYSVFSIAGTCMLCKSVVKFYCFISTEIRKKDI